VVSLEAGEHMGCCQALWGCVQPFLSGPWAGAGQELGRDSCSEQDPPVAMAPSLPPSFLSFRGYWGFELRASQAQMGTEAHGVELKVIWPVKGKAGSQPRPAGPFRMDTDHREAGHELTEVLVLGSNLTFYWMISFIQ
jgi:hypothetical protein